MNHKASPELLSAAPELLQIGVVLAALDALEASIHMEHLELDDQQPAPEPTVIQAAALVRTARLLRSQLRSYRRIVTRLCSRHSITSLPF
jgi:hypothetical protein